jgi:hypothetical protein
MAERFFWPQTFWLGGVGRVDGTDQIFRYEELDCAIRTLRRRFGLDPGQQTPHLRKVDRPDFRELYDDQMRTIVGRLYRRDADALGYTFVG